MTDQPPKRPVQRKLAEWITLSASILIVALVAAYLIYDSTRPQPPAVPIEVRVQTREAREQSGRYIVPVEIRNHGDRTVNALKIQVTQITPAGQTTETDFTIDYLGERASETAYLYVDHPPDNLKITARPLSYQLD